MLSKEDHFTVCSYLLRVATHGECTNGREPDYESRFRALQCVTLIETPQYIEDMLGLDPVVIGCVALYL